MTWLATLRDIRVSLPTLVYTVMLPYKAKEVQENKQLMTSCETKNPFSAPGGFGIYVGLLLGYFLVRSIRKTSGFTGHPTVLSMSVRAHQNQKLG